MIPPAAGPEPSAGPGVESVLAGAVPPGTYRWVRPADLAATRAAVEGVGWRFAHLDGAETGTKAALLDALGPALGLVGYHGRNLDALEECVRALADPVVLVWEGWAALAQADARTFRVVREILAGDGSHPGVWLLLPGPGPPLAAPHLPGLTPPEDSP